MAKKVSLEVMLERFSKTHGELYDYSLITRENYKNVLSKVPIICKKHGVFLQEARLHSSGCGCPVCCGNLKWDKKQFIDRANKIHECKYDYSKVEYTNAITKVTLICPKHGEFEQTPSLHLSGSGCPYCEMESRKGRANYKNRKAIQGVGILDVDFSVNKDEIVKIAYNIWSAIILRCYTSKEDARKNYSSYENCYISEEWHYFSNFLEWFRKNYKKGYAIDKDILKKGNRCYCKEYCCFVPQEINNLIINRKAKRGKYPLGVVCVKNNEKLSFQAQMTYTENGKKRNKNFGQFKTPYEAFSAYKKGKESHIKNVAKEYYDNGLIDKMVFDGLNNYKIDIND